MSTLFLDTTYDITLGLLDDSLKWLSWERFEGKRASSTLQVEVHRMLEKNQLQPQELKSVATVAGPGFYTGLRLSEGFADVLSFFQIPHYSFYSYDIPRMAGIQEGVWMTKAYRGEYFFFDWKGEKEKISLVATKDLPEFMGQLSSVYIHSEKSLDEKSLLLLQQSKSSTEMLKAQPALIFNQILSQKMKRQSYYFRAPEDEFRVST